MTTPKFAGLVGQYNLPIPWLAKHVGLVSERTFRYWVSGRPGTTVTVPTDAVDRMQRVNSALKKALEK